MPHDTLTAIYCPASAKKPRLTVRGFAGALDAAAANLNLGKRCPHGFRAYYSSVRLAQGKAPDVVAKELGPGRGDELVRDVYGVGPDESAQGWKREDCWCGIGGV